MNVQQTRFAAGPHYNTQPSNNNNNTTISAQQKQQQ